MQNSSKCRNGMFAQGMRSQRVAKRFQVQLNTGKECKVKQKDKHNTLFFDNLEACFKRRNRRFL